MKFDAQIGVEFCCNVGRSALNSCHDGNSRNFRTSPVAVIILIRASAICLAPVPAGDPISDGSRHMLGLGSEQKTLEAPMQNHIRMGVDIGGTFTDVVLEVGSN